MISLIRKITNFLKSLYLILLYQFTYAHNRPKSDISGALGPIHHITLKAFEKRRKAPLESPCLLRNAKLLLNVFIEVFKREFKKDKIIDLINNLEDSNFALLLLIHISRYQNLFLQILLKNQMTEYQ